MLWSLSAYFTQVLFRCGIQVYASTRSRTREKCFPCPLTFSSPFAIGLVPQSSPSPHLTQPAGLCFEPCHHLHGGASHRLGWSDVRLTCQSQWSPGKSRHINFLKLLTIKLVLLHFHHQVRDRPFVHSLWPRASFMHSSASPPSAVGEDLHREVSSESGGSRLRQRTLVSPAHASGQGPPWRVPLWPSALFQAGGKFASSPSFLVSLSSSG